MKLFRKKKKTQNISIDIGLFDKMKEFEKRRDIITAAQRPDNVDYGYSYQNPICSSSINQSEIFLNDLITFSGKKTTWERTGSISLKECNGLYDVIIDEYLIYVNNFAYVTLYICPYGHGPFYLPYGFLSNTGSYKSKHFANKEETTINDLKETFDSKLKSFYVENENCFLSLLAKHKKIIIKNGKIVLEASQMQTHIRILYEQIKFFEACVYSMLNKLPPIIAKIILFDAFENIEPFSSEMIKSVNIDLNTMKNRVRDYNYIYENGLKPKIAEEFKHEIIDPMVNFKYSQESIFYAEIFIDFIASGCLDLDTTFKIANMEKGNLYLAKDYNNESFSNKIAYYKDIFNYALNTYNQITSTFNDDINCIIENLHFEA